MERGESENGEENKVLNLEGGTEYKEEKHGSDKEGAARLLERKEWDTPWEK